MQPVGYLYDPDSHAAANARGENYWFAYAEEIFRQLGVDARAVDVRKGSDLSEALVDLRVLVVGDSHSAETSGAADQIARWVEDGGTLIGFAAEGLDEVFGNGFHSVTPQRDGGFAMTALMRLQPHALTTAVYSPFFVDQPLPVLGPVRKVVAAGSEPLAILLSLREAETVFPAVTHRQVGAGHAFYFAFDLAQTMWVLHKGRPIDGDYDLDGYLRLSDAMVTGGLRQDVPYADEMLFLLQNMMHGAGVPLVHQVPPLEGEVADLAVFFGGDDEGLTDGSQVLASDFMKSRGLPYHINIMPDAAGKFGLTVEEFRHIVANGHEPSLHYNFIDGFDHPTGFTQEDVQRQHDWFVQTFGHEPVASVNHWCRWTGWAEPAKWLAAAGGRADNSLIGVSSPPLNPVNNIGFAFGTAFPHYYYDDWRGENKWIDFLSEPIMCYEVGYFGNDVDPDKTHLAVDLAAYYHFTADFFHHPIYFAAAEGCAKAVDELLRYVGERKLRVVFMGCDGLWAWWDARRRSSVDVLSMRENETRFTARCEYADGMVVKVPAPGQVAEVTIGGSTVAADVEEHFGHRYVMVVCPEGESEVRVRFAEEGGE
jgi:hypothetical protein